MDEWEWIYVKFTQFTARKLSNTTGTDLLSVNTYHIDTIKGFKILPFGLKLWLYNFEQAMIYGQDSGNYNKFIHIKIYNHKFKQLIFLISRFIRQTNDN